MRESFGLGQVEKSDWPRVKVSSTGLPIDSLQPGSAHHARVLNYLKSRIDMSERAMRSFYDRWRAQEIRYQSYINLNDWEKELKRLNDKGNKAAMVSVNVPYSFFTISTIITYLLQVFAGRKPIFQVMSNQPEAFQAGQNMEQILQYQSDHTRFIRELFHFLNDTQVYGVGIFRTRWETQDRDRTVFRPTVQQGPFGPIIVPQRTVEQRRVFEGNLTQAVDPFRFFPDPRVPMERVNKDGEWVWWQLNMGKHELKGLEAEGKVKYIDEAFRLGSAHANSAWGGGNYDSARHLMHGGEPHAGTVSGEWGSNSGVSNNACVHQGSVVIIPRELGLGSSERPEKWMFSIVNKEQIVQAAPLRLDHDMHPVAVSEPYSSGYSFGSVGMSDYLGPMENTINWLINSHMDNVKKVLNDMLIVDPSMVEMQDLKRPGPGKLIRLKRAHFGRDVREAISQLNVQDVTRAHIQDTALFMQLGERISAVSENLLGIQDTGGRKTATEVRTATEGGVSRLSGQARIISAQAITDLTEQWSLNTQQLMSQEQYVRLVGQEGFEQPLRISPEHLVGDFYYPISDGTLPQDKVALLDIWQNVFATVLADPELRISYSVPKMFEFIADLGGAINIKAMRLNPTPDQVLAAQLQQGNVVPTNQAGNLPGSNNVQAVPAQPGNRAAGAIQ